MSSSSVPAWVWVGAGLALWAAGAAVTLAPTRGLRLNNPGNVRRSSDVWEGASTSQPDPDFVRFVAPEYGLRAMGRILLNYADRYGLNTVGAIVARYAPAHENPTATYTANVARELGLKAWQPFDVAARLPELMRAMVRQEQGPAAAALLSARVYDRGLTLLGYQRAAA